MTSSPPSSRLTTAVSTECPALPDGNRRQGLRSLWHLSRHLTARADDNHAAPSQTPRRESTSLYPASAIQARVRFLAYHRIKPHVPPLVRAPVNSFEFQPCGRTPQVGHLMLSRSPRCPRAPGASAHRLRRGLPGYLIPFDPHAVAPQRREGPGQLPPRSAFHVISTHFTATPRVPPAPAPSKGRGFGGMPGVEPRGFTADPRPRLRAL